MGVKTFMGDFETTVYEGQTYTEVWASALVELYTEDVKIFHSIDETFSYLCSLNETCIVYYHNLKFDGTFWLSYLIDVLNYKQAYEKVNDVFCWQKIRTMENRSFRYSISDRGLWYEIVIKVNGKTITLRDSLKLLPFSVRRIGNSFGTKHKKLEMEYKGYRYAGCTITDEEKKYIANDVLVVKEALEIMFNEGHDKLTIGSCCLSEFKKSLLVYDFKELFPNVYDIELDSSVYKYSSAGEYILKSYRGGWCYVVKGKENKLFKNGLTADVNSLYPSMMSSQSGNEYPIGKPIFWSGNYIPEKALRKGRYYFVRVRTRFYLKKGYLPFIQVKNNYFYRGQESLETSDIYNKKDGKYYKYYKDINGNIKPAVVELVLTMTDWELIKEHYDLVDCEILDGCYFQAMSGIFDNYIEKYKKIKMTSKGALRELAKLFLNNLYGKMATTTNSSFKVAYENDDGSVDFVLQEEHNKKPGYIPIGSAITSYARNFTIRTAQKNYYGADKRGFIYADTDSIHCDLTPEELRGVPLHNSEFCHWKLESNWDYGIFARQKTYIEHVIKEDGEDVEPYYNVKCAGMPDKCKQLFVKSITRNFDPKDYNDIENEFLKTKRTIKDFKIGLKVWGKLMPKRIKGGTILVETTYEMR